MFNIKYKMANGTERRETELGQGTNRGNVTAKQLKDAGAKLNEAYPQDKLKDAMLGMKEYGIAKLVEQAYDSGKGTSFMNRLVDAGITAENLKDSVGGVRCECLRIGKERYAFNRLGPVKIDDGLEFRDFDAFYRYFVKELQRDGK